MLVHLGPSHSRSGGLTGLVELQINYDEGYSLFLISSLAVSAGPRGPQTLSIGRPNRAYTSGSKGWGGRSQGVGVEGEVRCPQMGLESRS